MSSYNAVVAAARHSRRVLKLSSPSIVASSAHRPLLFGSEPSSSLRASNCSPTTLRAIASTSAAVRIGSTTNARSSSSKSANSSALLATAASLALISSYTFQSTTTSSCESNRTIETEDEESPNATAGPADESEEGKGGPNATVRDGMDAGSETTPKSHNLDNSSRAPAEAQEEDDDDDDPSNDEDTTCSICLINRQGPCRKYWLKFERCMKEHSAEKEKAEAKAREAEKDGEGMNENETEEEANAAEEEGDEAVSVEAEWDAFMFKSIQPGEDDDDDDDDDDDEDDDDDDEDMDENEDKESADSGDDESPAEKEVSLAERCDKFMIPWIGCIQSHRDVYSLISNAFYQKDYVDPLEDTIPEGRRTLFAKNDDLIGDVDGYVVKFRGAEIDLGNWREHVEADADVEDGNGGLEEEETTTATAATAASTEEPHLINAYAKFRLNDPSSGQPIEVAYIKDQKGRLLGFDSFTKRENDGNNEKADGTSDPTDAAVGSNDGECTFHIVPGETTSIAAYAIYRGASGENKESGENSREDFLYYTTAVPLPGIDNEKK